MEHILYEQIKKLEKAIIGLESISQIYDSPIDEKDKQLLTDILTRAYAKRDDLKKSYESTMKRKHKRIKFQPHHF